MSHKRRRAKKTASAGAARPLIRYDAMVAAIAAAYEVDELMEIHDQAAALEAAARVAMNHEAEHKALDIRLRAEQRAGELLAEMERGAPGRPGKNAATAAGISAYRRAIEKAGIPERTARRWQQLAAVSSQVFEAHLASDPKPSARSIIDASRIFIRQRPQMSEEALWLWSGLRDFERRGLIDADPVVLLEEMTEAMRADVRRIAPLVASLMNRCTEKPVQAAGVVDIGLRRAQVTEQMEQPPGT